MARYSQNSTLKDGQIAGLYDLQETLGCGHFAVVKVARHVFTGERVAVKVIDKTKLDEISRAHLFKEVRCMKLVQHPNVVRLYEVIDTQTKLYLVQELGDGGDMYEYIMNHEQGLSEDKARHYFQQIVLAIDYCHKLHIVHRDLKLENVIFFKSLDVAKLTDFGFSNKFSPGQKLDTSCGSLAYSAPEVLLGDSYEAPAVGKFFFLIINLILNFGFEVACSFIPHAVPLYTDCKLVEIWCIFTYFTFNNINTLRPPGLNDKIIAVCRLQRDDILLNIKFFWQFPCCPRNIHGVVCFYVVVIHVMKITRSHASICLPPWRCTFRIFTSSTNVFRYTVREFFSLTLFYWPQTVGGKLFNFTELSVISTVISYQPDYFLDIIFVGG